MVNLGSDAVYEHGLTDRFGQANWTVRVALQGAELRAAALRCWYADSVDVLDRCGPRVCFSFCT
jgi:hypothetical protein